MAGHGQRRKHEWRAGESGAYLAAGFAHQAGESIAGLHAAHRFAVKQSEGDGERVGALGVGCHGAVKVGETLQESINHTVTQGLACSCVRRTRWRPVPFRSWPA